MKYLLDKLFFRSNNLDDVSYDLKNLTLKTPAKKDKNLSNNKIDEKILEVKNITVRDDLDVARVKNVSFDLKAGEILGLAGVTGNGQTELLEALFVHYL